MRTQMSKCMTLTLLLGIFCCCAWGIDDALNELELSTVMEIETPQGFTEGLKDGNLSKPRAEQWFVATCLLPLPGLIAAAVYEPKLKKSELDKLTLAKGENYAKGYAKAFETKSRNLNMQYSASAFSIVLSLISISMSLNTITSAYIAQPQQKLSGESINFSRELRYEAH